MTERQIEAAKRRLPNYFKDMTPAQRREYEEDAWIESCFPKTSLMAHQFSHIEGHELEGREVVVVMRCRKSLYGFIQCALHALGMLCADVERHMIG